MPTNLNPNDDKLVGAVAVLINHINQLLSRLQHCSSIDSIKGCIDEGELKELLAELSVTLSHSEGLEALCYSFMKWQIVPSILTPLIFYAILLEDLEIQRSVLQILVRLVEVLQNLDDTTSSKDRVASYSTTLAKAFIDPILTSISNSTVFESKFLPKNLNLLWLVGKILVDNLSLVLFRGWSGVGRSVIAQVLSLIERLTCHGNDSTIFYSTKLCRNTTVEQIVSELVSLKIYDAVFVFLGAEDVRENIPDNILCLMVGVVAGPCYSVVEYLGPGFMSADIGEYVESSQENQNKSTFSVLTKMDSDKRYEKVMRWSSQHNSMIPIFKVYKDGERKYGHWGEKKERNVESVCNSLLKHAADSYKLGVRSDDSFAESFSLFSQRPPTGMQNVQLLCIEELFDSCMAFIYKWLLNSYTSILSNDCSYVKKLFISRFPVIISSYIRIVYSTVIQSDTMIHHLTYFLDGRSLQFLVWSFCRFVERGDYEMECVFLTTLVDYLSMLFVLVSRNEGLVSENFLNRQRIFECSTYPLWRFQAKQLVEIFFEKEELHTPIISYLKSLKARKRHSRPFLELCVQLLSILIGLHQILEQVAGSNLNVERTKQRRRKQVHDDEELSIARNTESYPRRVVLRPSELVMIPLIRSQTFELLLLPFHKVMSNEFLSEAKHGANLNGLSLLCRLCYMAWSRLWSIACSRNLRPQFYSATFFAFFYALNLPEAEHCFDVVFKDNGEFLSGLRNLSKEIADSFAHTFYQNILVAVDALFPMNSATSSYYENMMGRKNADSTTHGKENHRKTRKKPQLESVGTEESEYSMQVSRTGTENLGYLAEGTGDERSSRNFQRRRKMRVINDDDDDYS
ncbi:hypothetical protein GpartN1_g275.t1 [Galdieria partita]|uniref:Uncharacterized protein n=1 Tax=Galdieria partita TaxID=83374 RepID=A0A9C7UMC4_9RHOD|nr:hypothetical protein GpartN1_g275.t1 [Galdieria partita]